MFFDLVLEDSYHDNSKLWEYMYKSKITFFFKDPDPDFSDLDPDLSWCGSGLRKNAWSRSGQNCPDLMHCHSPLTSHTTQQSTLTTDPSTLSGLSLHSLLTIVHSHLTTQRSSLTNHHLTLTTNNSPFHIHHSPLTNHQSPLMTQNSTLATPYSAHPLHTLH